MDDTGRGLSGQIVLIVEQEPIVALNMELALQEAGAATVVASSCHEAMARLEQFAFTTAIIGGGEHALRRTLERQGVRVLANTIDRRELLAQLEALLD